MAYVCFVVMRGDLGFVKEDGFEFFYSFGRESVLCSPLGLDGVSER